MTCAHRLGEGSAYAVAISHPTPPQTCRFSLQLTSFGRWCSSAVDCFNAFCLVPIWGLRPLWLLYRIHRHGTMGWVPLMSSRASSSRMSPMVAVLPP